MIKGRDESAILFEYFIRMVKEQFCVQVKGVGTNTKVKFVAGTFKQKLLREGIVHQTTCTHITQYNKVVE